MAVGAAATPGSPLLLVPYLVVFLAAATVKSFLHSYSSSLRSLTRLLTSSITYASPKDRRHPNGGGNEHGRLQEDSLYSGSTTAAAARDGKQQQTLTLTGEEVVEVLRRMGLVGADERLDVSEFASVGGGEEVTSGVFDADEPSLEEVRRAFAVFDEDGDGFIGPADLRGALARLGFLEDVGACRRMIDAASCGAADRRGRMSLSQFVRFLESSF